MIGKDMGDVEKGLSSSRKSWTGSAGASTGSAGWIVSAIAAGLFGGCFRGCWGLRGSCVGESVSLCSCKDLVWAGPELWDGRASERIVAELLDRESPQ
ncbi:hypothetical protein AKJ60_00365 [candidate division MSBL1 archaeon SCGC-AAA385M11]|nr:hypothetical protein AKJ60_00365 [candidate division MSBL1 archaeon SCGC-AAA385M11]